VQASSCIGAPEGRSKFFWSIPEGRSGNKDDGAWSIPKGEIDEGEDPAEAALREFMEELGSTPGALQSYMCLCVFRVDWSYSKPMDSSQRCRDQAAKCVLLMKSAPSEDQAEVLRNISISWSRLAGQIDRYNSLVREQGRIARK
jgi:8-oxo-dGTP pyrophosphatase MutT (NUDIX family)